MPVCSLDLSHSHLDHASRSSEDSMFSARSSSLVCRARIPSIRHSIYPGWTLPCSPGVPPGGGIQWSIRRTCVGWPKKSAAVSDTPAESPREAGENKNTSLGSLSASQARQVAVYVDTLLDWNQRMNLTAVTDRSAVLERHVGDSLALLPVIDHGIEAASNLAMDALCKESLRVVDVGSGAGLPGLILAIARPEWEVTLLESLRKRCDFLEFVVARIGLKNVQIVCARAEDAGQRKDMREKYEVAVARAVADLRVLSELCLPLVQVGGVFVAAKGPNPEEEVESAETAVSLLGGRSLGLKQVESTGPIGQRTSFLCYKESSTQSKYPRRPGIPKKRPL